MDSVYLMSNHIIIIILLLLFIHPDRYIFKKNTLEYFVWLRVRVRVYMYRYYVCSMYVLCLCRITFSNFHFIMQHCVVQ